MFLLASKQQGSCCSPCRPKMPGKKRQGDEWRKPCISNMPGRRQNMPPEGQKCTSKKYTRETSAIYHVCQTCQGDGKAETEWIETSLSNLPGRREPAACRPKMPGKTRQGDEWRKPCISNMPGRRQNMPPEGQKCTSKKTYQGDLRYLSCMSNMPGRRQS